VFALKKRKNKKNRFLLGFCALIVAVAAVSVGLTLALTTVDKTYTTNVATIGEVKIELIDKYYDADGEVVGDGKGDMSKNGQEYTEDDPPVFGPDTTVHKTVKVKNTGKFPCYVRLLVKQEWEYTETSVDPATHTASQVIHDLSPFIEWTPNSKWVKGDEVTATVDDEPQTFRCYYYTDILPVNGTTDGLFTYYDTKDKKTYENMFHIGDYTISEGLKAGLAHITVMAQAVQSDYTSGDFGKTDEYTFQTENGKVVKWNGLIFE